MNETHEMTLYDYVQSKGISMEKFSQMTGISAVYLYRIQKNRNATGISVKIVEAIYQATLKEYGEGLDYHKYLNI